MGGSFDTLLTTTYREPRDAEDAKRDMNGADLDGRPITVDFATPRGASGPSGGEWQACYVSVSIQKLHAF